MCWVLLLVTTEDHRVYCTSYAYARLLNPLAEQTSETCRE